MEWYEQLAGIGFGLVFVALFAMGAAVLVGAAEKKRWGWLVAMTCLPVTILLYVFLHWGEGRKRPE